MAQAEIDDENGTGDKNLPGFSCRCRRRRRHFQRQRQRQRRQRTHARLSGRDRAELSKPSMDERSAVTSA